MVRLSVMFLLWIGAPILGVRQTLGVRHVINQSYDLDVVIQQTSAKPSHFEAYFNEGLRGKLDKRLKNAVDMRDLKRRKGASPSVTHPKPALNIGDRSAQQAVKQAVKPSDTQSAPSSKSNVRSAQQTFTQDVKASVTPSITSLGSDALSAQQVVGPKAGGPFVYKVKNGWVAACTGVEDWRCDPCIKDGKLPFEADTPEKDKTCRQGVQKVAYDHGKLGFLDTCDTGDFKMSSRNKKHCGKCLEDMAGFIEYVRKKFKDRGSVSFENQCKKIWFPKS